MEFIFQNSRVVHAVKVHVFTLLVPCCDVRYYFRVKQCSICLDSHLFCKGSYISILFVFIYAYWCATQFPFQMLFVSLNNIMKGFTYGAGTANASGALELNPPFWNSSCSIFSFLCYVL